MRRSSSLLLAGLLAPLLALAPPAVAGADGTPAPPPSSGAAPDTVTGGDVSGPGDEVPPRVRAQANDKMKVAEAYVAAYEGKLSVATYRKAQATYFATWGVTARDRAAADKAAQDLRARARRRAADRPVDKILGVPHFTQIKTYYCGPASGLMILSYLKEGRSAYNKDALDQRRIANAAHMRTDINGKTGWSTGLFRIGLNRWRSGSDKHFYIDKSKPTPKFFRTALIADIGLGMPFGADTVELRTVIRYNQHPNNGKDIGHWVVAIGYLKNGAQTRFADPASGMWPRVEKKFTVGTNAFVNTYLQSNGITW